MTKLEYKINQELKEIKHFHKVDSPISVVSNKRDHDIRQDMQKIAADARGYGIGVTANRGGDVGKWSNADIVKMADYYKETGLGDGTIINMVSSLRSFLRETGRTNITATNAELGLKRTIEYKDKSLEAKNIDINDKLNYFKEKDPNVYVQLKLAVVAGLRREEAIHAGLALYKRYSILKGNVLELKASWCKNNQSRNIELSDEKVREIKELQNYLRTVDYKNEADRGLKQEKNHLSNAIRSQGFNIHAARHSYAKSEFSVLIDSKKITEEAAKHDVTEKLGHHRPCVTKVYLAK
jgi:hypothetical protein